MLTTVMVELGINDVVGGTYIISLTLRNCIGATVFASSNTITVPRGIYNDSVFFDISPAVRMTDVSEVIVEVRTP